MSTNVVPLKSGGTISAIVPQTIEEVFRLSQGIAASGLAPKGMNTAEQITVAILTGMEIGLPPMFAIQKIAVVNGRPTLWGDAIPALLLARGFKLRERSEGIGDARVAYCEVVRPDGDKIERRFGVQDARTAGLWAKAGPWQQYPERMLQMRARGYACRDGAADVLSGLYLREEIEEPMRDITPAKPAQLAIPDIPDEPAKEVANQPAEDVEPIADPDGLLAKLADDIALCDCTADIDEVADQYADLIPRLPASHQARAQKMLSEAAE